MERCAENYSVYRFMTQKLGLKGAELQVYAVIYSFSRATGDTFFGSRSYLADTVGVSVRTVDRAIKSLALQGLITGQAAGFEAVVPEYAKEKG